MTELLSAEVLLTELLSIELLLTGLPCRTY